MSQIPAWISDSQVEITALKMLTRGVDDTQTNGTLQQLFGSGGDFYGADIACGLTGFVAALPPLPTIPTDFDAYGIATTNRQILIRRIAPDEALLPPMPFAIIYTDRGQVVEEMDTETAFAVTPCYVCVRVQREDAVNTMLALETARRQASLLADAIAYLMAKCLCLRATFDDPTWSLGIHSAKVVQPGGYGTSLVIPGADANLYADAGARVDVLTVRRQPANAA